MDAVIAADSFKGTLGAADVVQAIADGWRSRYEGDTLHLLPQADGGEGTVDAVERAVPGSVRRTVGDVTGPDGRPTPGEWLELPDGTAVIELAQMSGLPLMPELDALGATSRGFGEVIAAVLDAGAPRLVLGIGGSASTDAGVPMLEAIGHRRPPVDGAVVLTDVRAPLLGPDGAAAVFGPQKGASAREIAVLEERLEKVARQLGGDPHAPGAGAAGGVGYGLACWGARLEPGSEYIATLTGLGDAVRRADLALTGEGRFDASSRTGKVVGAVLELAQDTPVGVVAGSIAGSLDGIAWSASLTDLAGSVEAAMADPARWLREAGARAAAHWHEGSQTAS
ncbi:MAG: glycerate kinase [Microbacteriaceae bacterium]|nr:glycerate kinase [Microbacteriaceae bacterium]